MIISPDSTKFENSKRSLLFQHVRSYAYRNRSSLLLATQLRSFDTRALTTQVALIRLHFSSSSIVVFPFFVTAETFFSLLFRKLGFDSSSVKVYRKFSCNIHQIYEGEQLISHDWSNCRIPDVMIRRRKSEEEGKCILRHPRNRKYDHPILICIPKTMTCLHRCKSRTAENYFRRGTYFEPCQKKFQYNSTLLSVLYSPSLVFTT